MSKAQVVLVYANRLKPPVAPLGLEYLSNALKRKGFEVNILDLCFVNNLREAIERYFKDNEVFAVGINLRNIDQLSLATEKFLLPEFREIVSLIKAKTKAPLILGGPGFSLMPEAVLDYCGMDLGIRGEGEYSLPLLLEKIQKGEDFRDVPGLVYRENHGFHRNPFKLIDLSQFSPKRGTIDNKRYFLEGGSGVVEYHRGCSKNCIYCPDPWIKGNKIRFRNPDSVVDEMEELLRDGIDHIYFSDSEFNVPDEKHSRELCQKIIERGLSSKLRWNADILPVHFSEELAHLFLKAGCEGVAFNIECCSEKMLHAMGKDFGVEEIYRAAKACQRQGLPFIYYLLLGGPGETKETLKETAENLKQIPHHGLETVLGIRILPGTRLFEMVKSNGPLKQNPNLKGKVEGNENFLVPIFYLSSALGPEAEAREYLFELFEGDERFFLARKGKAGTFISNEGLIKAVKDGYRGVFWDILRKLSKEKNSK